MRSLFADPHNPDEAAGVHKKLAAIDRWWAAFESEHSKLENYVKRTTRWDLPGFMEESLQAIDPRLMWEFGPAVRQPGHRLVITPESHRTLRPMLRTILERAPQIPGWEFYGYRLAETPEQAVRAVENRVGVDVSEVRLAASFARTKNRSGIRFPGCCRSRRRHRLASRLRHHRGHPGRATTRHLDRLDQCGPRRCSRRTSPAPRSGPSPRRRTRPRQPRSATEGPPSELAGEMAAVKLDPPDEADDYPACTDLVSACTRNLELFQMLHGGESFARPATPDSARRFAI